MKKMTLSFSIISFILLFAIFQHSDTISPQQKLATREYQFKVGVTFGDKDIFEFIVKNEGVIEVEASWRGDAPQLALILNGPGRIAYYARKDGASPLEVSFNVTEDILKEGENWKVSIVNFSRRGSARGTVKVTYPSEEKIAPLIKVMPKKLPFKPEVKMIEVPNVIGMSLKEAEKTLEETEIKVSLKEITEFDSRYQGKEGQVVGQTQKAGYKLSRGSTIEILFYNPKYKIPEKVREKFKDIDKIPKLPEMPDLFEKTYTPWPMFGHDPKHTRRSPYLGAQTPTKKWEFLTAGKVDSSPVIGSDGTIYVGTYISYESNAGHLYAINPDGTKKWEFITHAGGITSSPAIGPDGTIYVGSRGSTRWDGSLFAVNPDGTKKWEFFTASGIGSSPCIGPDGTIYVGLEDGSLSAIDPDGRERWWFTTRGVSIRSTPAIGEDGTIYVGSNDHSLYAINPDGTRKWRFTTGDSIRSTPAIGSDGTIYVGSNDKHLYAINPDGSKKWEFYIQTGGPVDLSSPAIGFDGTIYVFGEDGSLFALNPDRTIKWWDDNRIIGAGYAGIDSSPAIGSDGTIYIGGGVSGKLHAINPDGSKKWEFRTGSRVDSSPAIGSDGIIYVGSWDHKLYAIGGVTLPD